MLCKLNISFCLIALSMIVSSRAIAEVLTSASTNQIIETSVSQTESPSFFKKINGSLGFGYESDFYEYKASDKEQSLNLLLELTIKVNDWKYGVNSLVSKKLIKDEKSQFGDTKISATRTLYFFAPESSFSSSLSTSLVLPTSEVSKYEKNMYGNFSAGPTVSWKNNNFNFFILPRLGKVFNKYKTTFDGGANTSYYAKMTLVPIYQISNNLSSQLTTSITQAWTDNHNRKAPTYASEISSELKIDPNLSLSVAIANEDKIYKSNGTSTNLKIFDKKLSVYSLTVTKDF